MRNLKRMMPLMIIAALTTALLASGPVFGAESAMKAEENSNQKTVLVTGASTGIGRKITEVLAARGVYVYAGARKEKDLSELDAIDNV
jgi:NADPH:quinone reductase-like Zn-dependent oxidoreductase